MRGPLAKTKQPLMKKNPEALSAVTPFDLMSKAELSEYAKTGWMTYFEVENKYYSVLYRVVVRLILTTS